jgi:hypothetical protein
MAATIAPALSRARLRPLARALAATFLIAGGAAQASTVTNCLDSGAGSLRAAVTGAASGDTVDMSKLTTASLGCQQSRISLTTGEIKVKQNSLTIAGPGTDFIVSGKYYGDHASIQKARIFNHTGSGTLTLKNFALRFGYVKAAADSSAIGGCVLSKSTVELDDMAISICRAVSPNYAAGGGAVSANDVRVLRSTMTGNSATGGSVQIGFYPAGGYGGAIEFRDSLYMAYSTISANSTAGNTARGGAISAVGYTAYIKNSTIASNTTAPAKNGFATGSAIDMSVIGNYYSVLTLLDTTVTGNKGGDTAVNGQISRVTMYNSTVAFNDGGGLAFFPNINPGGVTLFSNIFSNNVDPQYGPSDLFVGAPAIITGDHNLVLATTNTMPPGNIVGQCPLLAPLHDNGGPTQTMMLHSGSPAIDAGSNVRSLDADQRGVSYARGSGPPDVGAYEVQQNDIVFNAAFDGC